MYMQVLKIDPKNIWASNGIGAVLGKYITNRKYKWVQYIQYIQRSLNVL